jgi:Protein of unknown function (DUF5818)
MRKTTILVMSLLLVAAAALPLFAAEGAMASQSWTGWITDSHCGVKGANAHHTKACVEKCVKEGGKVVFYNNADKKMYEIDKTDEAMGHIGHEVTVTGHLDGNTIHVESITPAKAM